MDLEHLVEELPLYLPSLKNTTRVNQLEPKNCFTTLDLSSVRLFKFFQTPYCYTIQCNVSINSTIVTIMSILLVEILTYDPEKDGILSQFGLNFAVNHGL